MGLGQKAQTNLLDLNIGQRAIGVDPWNLKKEYAKCMPYTI